jgi:hypothetical protein
MKDEENTNRQLEGISNILEECDNYSLTPEVVYFALKEMQMNPTMSPLLAMEIASEDWDVI